MSMRIYWFKDFHTIYSCVRHSPIIMQCLVPLKRHTKVNEKFRNGGAALKPCTVHGSVPTLFAYVRIRPCDDNDECIARKTDRIRIDTGK